MLMANVSKRTLGINLLMENLQKYDLIDIIMIA